MEAQGADWVDTIRYFRGLGPSRRRRLNSLVFAVSVAILSALTVMATLEQFA